MMIVAEVQSESLRRCISLRKKFEGLTLVQFKGENVRDWAKEAHSCLLQLERDGQLPPLHLLDIVDQLTACSVMDFKVIWMAKRAPVEQFLKESTGKDESAIALMPNRIHFNDLIEEAKTGYTNLLHKWGNQPTAKEQALTAKITSLEAKVAQMNQKLSVADGKGNQTPKKNGNNNNPSAPNPKHKDLTCHNCGEKGHIKPHCPKKGEGNGTNNNNNTSNADKALWAPPKDGESWERMIKGSLRFWCPKCRRGNGGWTNHKAAAHVDGFKKKMQGANNAATPPAAANLAAASQQLMCWETWNE